MTVLAEKKTPKIDAFHLKGSLLTMTVLHLQSSDLKVFQTQLAETIGQAPKFFAHAPIIIDLNDFPDTEKAANMAKVSQIMREHKLIPVGIRGGNEASQQAAKDAGLAILSNSAAPATKSQTKSKKTSKVTSKKKTTTTNRSTVQNNFAKIITQPVRSGQQIYAKNTDLVILAPVSHGAEVLADGSIHIYDKFRGRALAGVLGNTEAQIFCHELDAELISIAGRYLINEQFTNYKSHKRLHISLQEDELQIKPL